MAPRNDEPAPLGASQGVSIKAQVWMMLKDKRFGLHEANHDFGLVVLFFAMELLCRFYLAFATPWNPCRRDRVLSHGIGMGLSANGKDPAALSPGGGHRDTR